jgi:hypothetical protein
MDYSSKVNELFTTQLRDWELARINYSLLGRVMTRSIAFGQFPIVVQFNPERIRSSAAKVDAKSIEARPCFLCAENRPPEQRGVKVSDKMTILVNPFPIFDRHLTIVSDSHTDQRILPNFSSMLTLAASLRDYVIFYNGPECGASAPDHFHFQAGNRGFLPIESDFENGGSVTLLADRKGVEIWVWNGYGRGIATLKGRNACRIAEVFAGFYVGLLRQQPERPEPMLNILAYSDGDELTVHLIPRRQHRPTQFFAAGDSQILLSPASVDLGGVIITPREEDYRKITGADIADIFSQVSLGDKEITKLLKEYI